MKKCFREYVFDDIHFRDLEHCHVVAIVGIPSDEDNVDYIPVILEDEIEASLSSLGYKEV